MTPNDAIAALRAAFPEATVTAEPAGGGWAIQVATQPPRSFVIDPAWGAGASAMVLRDLAAGAGAGRHAVTSDGSLARIADAVPPPAAPLDPELEAWWRGLSKAGQAMWKLRAGASADLKTIGEQLEAAKANARYRGVEDGDRLGYSRNPFDPDAQRDEFEAYEEGVAGGKRDH